MRFACIVSVCRMVVDRNLAITTVQTTLVASRGVADLQYSLQYSLDEEFM